MRTHFEYLHFQLPIIVAKHDVAGILTQIQEPCHIILLLLLDLHLKVLTIIKCYIVSGSIFECLLWMLLRIIS